jgi:hypothetical protein
MEKHSPPLSLLRILIFFPFLFSFEKLDLYISLNKHKYTLNNHQLKYIFSPLVKIAFNSHILEYTSSNKFVFHSTLRKAFLVIFV